MLVYVAKRQLQTEAGVVEAGEIIRDAAAWPATALRFHLHLGWISAEERADEPAAVAVPPIIRKKRGSR